MLLYPILRVAPAIADSAVAHMRPDRATQGAGGTEAGQDALLA